MVLELAKDIYWVGVVDWGIRHFHGFELSTHRGTSYNSFLIKDEKIALVDTVWDTFTADFMENLRKVVDPSKIDYVIANHSEPDHSGSLPEVMKFCPNATVVVSKQGASSIPGHHHQRWNFKPVSTGDTLSLGRRSLTFVEASMLHWPDSMFTYISGDNILMPNDAFGQHYATAFRYNDQVDQNELMHEAVKYYANILLPFSSQVIKKIDELVAMNLPISMIAPSHGVLWRKDPMQIVQKYRQWAQQQPAKTAVVLYDTMWNATRRMAEAIGDGLRQEGIEHKLFHMAVSDRNDVMTEVFKAKGLAIGSPSLNNGLLPSVMPMLEDIKGLRFQNKVGVAFGSYGWSGECVKLIEEHYAKCKIPLAAPGVRAKWQPTPEDLENCRKLGLQLAEAIKKD